MINGVILAGGLSKRMGKDKGLLMYKGKTAVEHLYAKLSPICQRMILVTNRPEDYRELVGNLPNICMISDEIKQLGPLSGIHAALGETDVDYNMVVACDMPNADPKLFIEYSRNQLEADYQLLIAKTDDGRFQPLHAIYHKSCRGMIEEMLITDKLRLSGLADQVRTKVITFTAEEQHMFRNVNTPEEYASLVSNN